MLTPFHSPPGTPIPQAITLPLVICPWLNVGCLVVDPVPEDIQNEDSVEFFHVEGSFDSLQDVDVGTFRNAQNRSAIMMLASSSEGRSTIGVAHPERGVQLCLIAESELTEDARDVEKFTLSDLDGDGVEDLLAVAREPQRNRAELRLWTHDAALEPLPLRRESGTWAIPIPEGRRVCDLSTADLNGDGRRDVALLLDSHDWSLVDDVIIGLNLKHGGTTAADERRSPRYRFQFRSRLNPDEDNDRPRHCSSFIVHRDESPVRLSERHRSHSQKSRFVDGLLTPGGEWIIADDQGRPVAADYWDARLLHAHFDRPLLGSRIALSRQGSDNTQLVIVAWTDEDEKDGAQAMLMAIDRFQYPDEQIRYTRVLDTDQDAPHQPTRAPRALTVGALKGEKRLILVGFADGRIKSYTPDIYDSDLGPPSNQGKLSEQQTFDLLKPTNYAKGPRDLELVGGLALGDIDKNGEIDIVVTSPEAASFSVIYFDPVEYF